MCSTSLPMDSSKNTLSRLHAEEHQLRADRNTDQRKRIYRPTQNFAGQRKWGGGGNKSIGRTGPALRGWGNGARCHSPHTGAIVPVQEERHLRLRVRAADLCQPKWVKSDSPCYSHTYSGQGTRVPCKVQQLGAGVLGIVEAIRVGATVDCGETDQGRRNYV